MIEISQSEVTRQLRNLFGPNAPNSHKCFGVLDGDVLGIILAHNPGNPTWGLVREAGLGASFVGGNLVSILSETGALVMAKPGVQVSLFPQQKFDADGRLVDEATRGLLRAHLGAFLRWTDAYAARAAA